MNKKFHLISLGCPKNLVDSEIFFNILQEAKYEETKNIAEAHLILINTCGFIMDAQEESINTILETLEYKSSGKAEKIYVTGCLVKRFSDELLHQIPEVDGYINLKDFAALKKILNVNNLENKRSLLTPKHYAYVRVSDGCNNNCSYCVIPQIRGKHKSVPMEEIISEVENLVNSGVKEIILLAQDTAQYGVDIYGRQRLHELLDQLNKLENLKWLRLFYLHPAHLSSEIIDSIARNDKVLHYFEVPLQHINNQVLAKMNRHVTKEEIINKLDEIRTKIPDAVFRTTFIVGHPGETENRFLELTDFIKEQKFGRLGVFPYSPEEGTVSFDYKTRPSKKKSIDRMDYIMAMQQPISTEFLTQFVDTEIEVIVEKESNEEGILFEARSKFDAPEIDGIVYIVKGKTKVGDIVKVRIIDSWEYDLIAEVE